MKFYLTLIVISLLPSSLLFAQISISGLTMDSAGKPLNDVTVSLLHLPDSSLHSQAGSDENGQFTLQTNQAGAYVIKYSYLGYNSMLGTSLKLKKQDNVQLAPVFMETSSQLISGLSVRGKRPALKQEVDRLIIDVEGSISAEGNNVMELLEKTPGIISDGKGNFSIQGRAGAKIKIDGRDVYVSGVQLSNMLKGMQARDIATFELMSSPSAKEDAEGSAGSINIITKKNKRAGFGGDVFLRGGYSREPQGSTGGGLHYKTDKINVFTNASTGFEESRESKIVERLFYQDGLLASSQLQNGSVHTKPGKYHSVHTGMIFQPDTNQTLELSFNWIKGTFISVNNMNHQLQASPSAALEDQAKSVSHFDEGYNNLTFNMNYLRKYKHDKHFLKANIDYAPHSNKYDNSLSTALLNNSEQETSGRKNIQKLSNTTYAVRIDYSQPLAENHNIELGWKGSYLAIDNSTRNDTLATDSWMMDSRASNAFRYSQHVQAGYLIYSGKINAFEYQAGIRGEYTALKADQRTLNKVDKTDYFDWFPNAYALYHFNESNFLRAAFSSRIERPGDHEVNIFRTYDDHFTYTEGNADLKPEKSHIIELGHGYKSRLFTTASMGFGSDVIRYVTRAGESANQIFSRPENIGSFRNYSLGIMYSNQFTTWWSGSHYANAFHNSYKGEIAQQSLNAKGANWNMHSKHNLQLKWGMQSELTAYYNSGITTGAKKNDETYGLDLALEKKLFSDRALVKLAVNGLIRNARTLYTSTFDNLVVQNSIYPDSRKVLLSLNYRFGD